ncbi:MAG: hypothetical protein WCJ35_10655 [Planctomycetota bacterium]
MVTELKQPLTARNGHTLKVVLPCRVSDPGPGKQDIMSLADQEAMHRRWLNDHTSLPLAINLLLRRVAHLAFFEESYYDRVIAKVDARNAKYRHNVDGTPDPCQDRPKKRTRFPGQTVYCGICGMRYVFGGHGQRDHLMCDGARKYRCWNGITFDSTFAAKKFSEAALFELRQLENFNPIFLNMVNEESLLLGASRNTSLQEINRELSTVQREIENVMKFIRGGDASERVRADLKKLEDREKLILRQKDEIESAPNHAIVVPSAAEIMEVTESAFQDLAMDSFEFAKRMRELTGKIYVYPFRLCDGAPFVLRAKFRLRLAGLLPDKRIREVLQKPLERLLKIDLFDMPQRVVLREKILAGRQERNPLGHKITEREVAKSLGITTTAAQRAAALDRIMKQQGITDPYVLLLDPPMDYPKFRRHLHPRYHFEPLPGHVPSHWATAACSGPSPRITTAAPGFSSMSLEPAQQNRAGCGELPFWAVRSVVWIIHDN